MRVLAIGGTGFIGAAAVSALQSMGYEVAVFHRGRTAPRAGALEIIGARDELPRFTDRFRAFGPDVVLDTILSNGRQAGELMRTVKDLARRVVALSSIDVYRACGVLNGTEPGPLQPVPLTEDSELRAKPPYGADAVKMLRGVFAWLDDEYDKIPAEREVLSDPDLPGTVLRLPMVYGPGDPLDRLAPILKRISEGNSSIVLDERLGAWRAARGYVENVAAAIALAVSSDRAAGRIYNVAEPENFSELEWTRKVAHAAGWKGGVETALLDEPLPGNVAQHWSVSTARIRDELGFREPVAVEDALARTVEWALNHY